VIRDLEVWVRGHSRSLKLVPFESMVRFPIRLTMVLSCIISETKRDVGQKLQLFHTLLLRRPRYGVPDEIVP